MNDKEIVGLFWHRSEDAIPRAAERYGTYLRSIAYGILSDTQDADECVNDSLIDAWSSIPPHSPENLMTYLGKITRRIAIDRLRKDNAKKRGGGELPLVLDELCDIASSNLSIEDELERKELLACINTILHSLPQTQRQVFVCRYWYLDSVSSIAKHFGFSESKVTSMLHRIREKLKNELTKEGYL